MDVTYLWLNALKHINPLYRNAIIIKTEAIYSRLLKIVSDLRVNARIVDNETDIMMDRLVTPENALSEVTDIPVNELAADI